MIAGGSSLCPPAEQNRRKYSGNMASISERPPQISGGFIFANGTESNLLLRSLQRAFYDDPAARRLVSLLTDYSPGNCQPSPSAVRHRTRKLVRCIFWTIVGTDSDASWAVILIDRGH